MEDRAHLVSRKHEVRGSIERAQLRLNQMRNDAAQATGWFAKRRHNARIRQLEGQLERLMSEEFNLRQAIDRSR